MSVKQKKKTKTSPVQLLLLCLCLIALGVIIKKALPLHEPAAESDDPHSGQVQVLDSGGYSWITPAEGMPVSGLSAGDFIQGSNGEPVYTGGSYDIQYGIDVSVYQGDIDWQAVKDSGIGFAIIRCGGRLYGTTGEIYPDEYFDKNLEGAKNAGLMVGAYFFSQAISIDEAIEEAEFALECLNSRSLDLPVFFDWEIISGDTARTDGVDGTTLTDCAEAFCRTIESSGCRAGIYSNTSLAYHSYDLSRLCDYTLWYASPGYAPNFYYEHELWQYSFEGDVPGIGGKCDLDMRFVR